MSEHTTCNRCTLDDIIRRHPADVVTVERIRLGQPLEGWFRVLINGTPDGTAFMQLTEGCEC